MSDDLVKMARAAMADERLSDGALYGKLADRIDLLEATLLTALQREAEATVRHDAKAAALTAERDALAEKLERAVARLTAMRDDREGYRHTAHFRRGAAVELAQITGGKTDDQHTD